MRGCHLLGSGYEFLYVGRNLPVQLADGTERFISKGPDIIAVNKATGRTVIVEVKGSVDNIVLTGGRLRSKVGGTRMTQNTRNWISTNAETRYLDTLTDAADTKLQDAAAKIDEIIAGGDYESIMFGYGPGADSRFGKIDDLLTELISTNPDVNAAEASIFLIPPP